MLINVSFMAHSVMTEMMEKSPTTIVTPLPMVFSRMIFSESFMLSSGHLLTMKRFLQLKRPPKVGIREQNERKF